MDKSNKRYLDDYEKVADEIKFLTNSIIRLKILNCIFKKPHSMKEINMKTKLSYSSISSNIHGLEVEGYVYRDLNKYYSSNVVKLFLMNIFDLNNTISLLNNFFNFFDSHIIKNISKKSIIEIHLLSDAKLIETDEKEAYRTYNTLHDFLNNNRYIKGIFPYSYSNFHGLINKLIDKNVQMEFLFPLSILNNILNKIDYYNKNNINISYFKIESNFFLLITENSMALGLFKSKDNFDQNRLLISKSENNVKWAENLFKNFKNENKIERVI